MGKLAALLTVSSSHRAKKTGVWQELMDAITDCMFEDQLDAVVESFSRRRMDIPYAWDESLADIVEKRREEIRSEDIDAIVRDLYDFT